MGFLTKEGLQNLTDKLVQGDAIKVASHRGKNVKEVIDNIQRECESVALPNTMTLENRVSEFKIGKGRDVDVSRDVEEGKIEVELQGKTYQNLCESNCNFNAQYSSNFNTQTYDDKVVVTRINENNSGWTYYYNNTLKAKMLKPSTVYTLFFKYETNFTNVPRIQFTQMNALQNLSGSYNATKIKDNIYMCKITTLSSFDDKEIGSQVLYFYNSPCKTGDKVTLYKHMVLLEGDYSETPIDEIPKYFEGIKSSFKDGVVDVEVQGKNLFGGVKLNIFNDGHYVSTPNYHKAPSIKLKPNTSYVFSSEFGRCTDASLFLYSDGVFTRKIEIYSSNGLRDFKTDTNENGMGFYFNVWDVNGNILATGKEKFQLEEGTKKSDYEPYNKKKISFNIGEPLRSLPNGVRDTIEGNKLIQRIGKMIVDGTTNISINSIRENTMRLFLINSTIKNVKETDLPFLCNSLEKTTSCWNDDIEGIFQSNSGNKFIISILISKLTGTTVNDIKTYFAENPMTIYYELETPTITPIEPIKFDVKPLATITINSDIAPISNHKVVLNRTGQIEQGIELIANLKSRINELENIYDSNLIAIQYRIDNLKLNYELEREED